MTVPNAGQSPGLFPAQNNTNFGRIKTLVGIDHVWSDSSSTTQGYHNKVSLLNLVDPTTLNSANGIAYTKNDATSGANQLYFYNGATVQQLSGYQFILPIKISGSQSVAAGGTINIVNVPYSWAGTAFAIMNKDGTPYTFYNAIKFGVTATTVDLNIIDVHTDSVNGLTPPSLLFNTGILQIKNNATSTQTLVWSVILNRLS